MSGADVFTGLAVGNPTSTTTGLTGFFLNANPSVTELDGAVSLAVEVEYVLPFAVEDATAKTELTVVNPGEEAATATQFNSPLGIWGDGTNMWVVDLSNHTIRKIVISSQNVTTVAGTALSSGSTDDTGSSAQFTSPQTIWVMV